MCEGGWETKGDMCEEWWLSNECRLLWWGKVELESSEWTSMDGNE